MQKTKKEKAYPHSVKKNSITNIINTIPITIRNSQHDTKMNIWKNIKQQKIEDQFEVEKQQKMDNQFVRSSNKIRKTYTNFRSNSLINLVNLNNRNAKTGQMDRNKNHNMINLAEGRKTQTPQLLVRPSSINSVDNTNNKEQSMKFHALDSSNSNGPNRNRNRVVNNQYQGFSLAIGHKNKLDNKSKQYQSNSSSLFQMKAKFNSKQIQKKSQNQSQKQIKSSRQASRQKNTKPEFSNLALCLNPRKTVPEQIEQYLTKKQQVEIIKYFNQYKKQFFTKSKLLQDYINSTQQPQKVRNTYMNEEDMHFKNALQASMLKLYRNGTIVPHSYDNLRQDAVDQIQKWVISWIHRKILYGKLCEDEENQVLMVQDSIKHLEQYKKMIESQDTSF